MRFLTTFGLMLILAGCGNAKWTSIYREYKISDSYDTQNALIDAKQRAILSSPIIKGGGKDGGDGRAFIVCAEPSPDAVSALSSALSASLGVDIAGKGGGSGSFASALTEGLENSGKEMPPSSCCATASIGNARPISTEFLTKMVTKRHPIDIPMPW
jgi:hypothetical protein